MVLVLRYEADNLLVVGEHANESLLASIDEAFTRSLLLFLRNESMAYINGCSLSQAKPSDLLRVSVVGYRDCGVVA